MTALSEFYKIGNTSIERVIEGTPYVLVELSHELRFILENLPKKRTRLSDSDVLYIRENPDNITIEEMSEKLSITRKHLLRIRKGQQRAA